MSQRLFDNTKWFWFFLSLQIITFWDPVTSITVRTPPNNPATVEAQAKFFQDFFSVQLSPYKLEFGHVCEDPNTWEQRYEKKDFKNHRDMGKVRWGDKKGGYGEHYWDLNHAGHSNDHGNDGYDGDDGSYHESNDPYDEHNDHSAKYTDEYDPEKSSYEESGRAKRAHPKIKVDRKRKRVEEFQEEPRTLHQKQRKEEHPQAETQQEEDYEDEEEAYEPPPQKRHQYRKKEVIQSTQQPPPPQTKKEKNNIVLVVTQKDEDQKQNTPQHVPATQLVPPTTGYQQFVPYEGGAGVRQHQQPETSASVPRLFLEPSTGHVVDRATGQAYVLQPIAARNNYN